MFYQTKRIPHASRRQRALPSPRHSPGCDAMVPPPAEPGLQHTADEFQCIVIGDDSAVFRFLVPGNLDL